MILNLEWRILIVSGHRMPKPCKAMGNLQKRYPLLDSSNMIVWTVIWIMNLLYQLRVHARWVSGSKYTSESVPHSIIQVYYPVLRSTPPELPCSTKCYTIESRRLCVCWSDTQSDTKRYPKRCPNYSSTTPYYKVLLQYYSVLESTTLYYKALLRTTKYYSSITLYWKVLLCTTKHFSVLQSTTPVLLRTTKYYSSITLYCKVLLQYYSSTTPVLLRATKYYANTTPYYKLLLQYYSVLLAAVTVAAPHGLRMKKNPHEKDCECSCIQHNWRIPPNP